MNTTTKALSIAAIALMGLTACGSTVEPSSEPTEVPAVGETATDTATTEATDEPMDGDALTDDDGNPLSDRGLHVLKEGSAFDEYDSEGFIVGMVTINKVIPNLKCTEDPAIRDEPANGRFIALDVSIVTPNANGPDSDGFYLSTDAIDAIDANGTTMNGSVDTMEAMFCLPESELAPETMRPGSQARGKIVLDVPKGDITIASADMWSGQGWELEVPAK